MRAGSDPSGEILQKMLASEDGRVRSGRSVERVDLMWGTLISDGRKLIVEVWLVHELRPFQD